MMRKEQLAELDERYVQKKDLHKITDEYATKEEVRKISGEINALKIEAHKNNELLEKIYEQVAATRLEQRDINALTKKLERDLGHAKMGVRFHLWNALPPAFRGSISVLVIFVGLVCLSVIAGDPFDTFMVNNGGYVAIGTAVVSLVFSTAKGGDNNDKDA